MEYKNYLKVGIFREFEFDDTFNQLNSDNLIIGKDYKFYGLYFKDYPVKVPKKKNSFEERKTHPYFFPSGAYYKTIKDKYFNDGLNKETFLKKDNAKKIGHQKNFDNMMTELSDNIILMSDYDNPNKINKIIERY